MVYRRYIPAPPLCRFVELLWYYEGAARPHAKERILPDGSMGLVVNLNQDEIRVYDPRRIECFMKFRGASVSGPRSEFSVIDTAEQKHVMGVHFKPGGGFPFFHLPASELRNLHVALEDVWGQAAADLRDQLLEAPTVEDKFRVLESCLLQQMAKPTEPHPAVAFALRHLHAGAHARTISDLTDQVGLSPTHFIHVFREEVGLAPKLFCRVRRFQKVLHLIGRERDIDWAGVALSCGYFDQSHFNHDFRAFSGINPSTYVAERTEHRNHVPLVD
jgi:AraC-like DNA-binding protein